ncbi:MAG: aminomethyl-transferring glycine dehydrogenase [Candidatus Marinimicrobia bacterium]|nr:aminomethyl-transferring glycine dehydrogenase [Candidatus Neomarinimicrobiota bacterium]
MPYIPITDNQEREMLEFLGFKNYDELLKIIPESLRIRESLGLKEGMSEFEIENDIKSILNMNNPASEGLCFLGGGVYDHYVPKIVDFLSSRSEFYTAYTPYQSEVSQGTLQYLFEFQSMICELSGMDVANASLYDGASALAEACSLAINTTRKQKLAISSCVNPRYLEVVKTYLQNRGVEIDLISSTNGITNNANLQSYSENYAAIVIQSPNFYGLLENIEQFKLDNVLLISVNDPISLSTMEPPRNLGADIYVGEGQVLGNYMSYGGPYLGLFATTNKYMRKLPGRVVGKTLDKEGKEGFTLTLQTREQHIRRESATSNICTNQGLLALRATIYMAIVGSKMPELAHICYNKSHYAADLIDSLNGFSIPYGRQFIKEFLVDTPVSAEDIVTDAVEENIFISSVDKDGKVYLQISITEKRTKAEIEKLVKFLKKYEK